jgi:hypothetical protein
MKKMSTGIVFLKNAYKKTNKTRIFQFSMNLSPTKQSQKTIP